jgi:RNA-directed DNA polymerase
MHKSVLHKLYNHDYWLNVFTFFESRSFRQKQKLSSYREILDNKLYVEIAEKVLEGNYSFKIPLKMVVNKLQTGKKKTVYLFDFQDDYLLKVINRILTEEYAGIISPACHSFQKSKGAKTAFRSLVRDVEIDNKCCLKTDIQNFFNNIDVLDFIDELPQEIKSDSLLFDLIKQLLLNKKARLRDEQVLYEQKGLMAGCPLSPFLSNIYLRKLDNYFTERKITYTRYSDDIVVFDYADKIEGHKKTIESFLESKKLCLNYDKTSISNLGENAIFLGFSYKLGQIDLSPVSIEKMKGKIRRLSRSYNRRIVRRKMNHKESLEHFISRINRKLYGIDAIENDLCWARWFFPVINTSQSLEILDKYIQERLRYSITGKNNKANYKKVSYQMLKDNGYISLKAVYYAFKRDYDEYLSLITRCQLPIHNLNKK